MTGSSSSGAPDAADAESGAGTTLRFERLGRRLSLAGLVILTLVLALPSLDNGFSLDDYNWLERARFRDSDLSFVLQSEPGQVFNPVGRGFFLALFALGETNPLPYRLQILALHSLNVCLLFLLVERSFGRRDLALAAAFLFTVQSSYHEAQFWIAAFFHPLNAAFCLGALLAYLVFLDTSSRVALRLALVAFGAALLTKAPAFIFALLFPAALVAFGGRRSHGWRHLLAFAAVWSAALVLNLVLRLDQSYLVERGYYRLGLHAFSNLGSYLAWMAVPFSAVAEKLGVGEFHRMLTAAARFMVPMVLLAVLVRLRPRVRFFVGFVLVALASFLPFTFEPTSRYTYLAAAGFAAVLALGVSWLGARLVLAGPPRAALGLVIGALLALLALADAIVVDHAYEYREQMGVRLVADVQRALPVLPADRTIRIVGLPRFGVDPGIHLEAALRLSYREPSLRLELVPDEVVFAGCVQEVLRFSDGRIVAGR